jgi:hypothetical protein
MRRGGRFWFAVPAAASFGLRSTNGVLCQMMPGLGDNRRLGVALSGLRIDGASVALEDVALDRGFYPLERDETHGWRWTDGDADIDLALTAPAMVEVELAMIAPNWKRAMPALRVVA